MSVRREWYFSRSSVRLFALFCAARGDRGRGTEAPCVYWTRRALAGRRLYSLLSAARALTLQSRCRTGLAAVSRHWQGLSRQTPLRRPPRRTCPRGLSKTFRCKMARQFTSAFRGSALHHIEMHRRPRLRVDLFCRRRRGVDKIARLVTADSLSLLSHLLYTLSLIHI